MKLRKIFTMLFAMALLASCSNDSLLEKPQTEVVPEDAVAFSVNFPSLNIRPMTYGDAKAITDGTFLAMPEEKTLSDVKIYVFDSDETSGTKKAGNLVSVEQVTDLQSGNNAEMPSNTANGKFYLRKLFNETAFFVAVANVDFSAEDIHKLIGKSFQEVANTLVTQVPGVSNNFPMVSVPVEVQVPIKGTAGTAKTFTLERLAVRIDIINETQNSTDGDKKFEIKAAYIPTGSLNQSYLINTLADKLYVGDSKGTMNLHPSHPINLTRTNGGVGTENEEYFHQIYTYENRNTDFELNLEGFIDGKTFAFPIQFKKELVRNTRYLVRLQNAKNNTKTIKYSIEVLPWNEGGQILMEGEALKFKPQIVSVDKADATGTKQTGAAQHTVNGTKTEVKLNTPDAYNLRLVVKSNVDIKFDGPKGMITPWVSYEEKTAELSEQILGAQVKVYHLKIAKNEDAEKRTAKLVFYTYGNEDQPSKQTELSIEQKEQSYDEIVNPLAFLSNRFVDGLNTPAQPTTRENMGDRTVHGKWYQWGRNVPLDIYKPLTLVRKGVPFTSEEVKAPNIFYNVYTYSVWSSDNLVQGNTWEGIVEKAPLASGILGYEGNNGGDPSYPGFKMPTLEQMVTIFPSHAKKKTYNQATAVPSKDYPSPIQIQGIVGDAKTAKPYNFHIKHVEGSLIFYALTLDETGISSATDPNKYRTAIRYEFIPYKGLVVTARHMGKEAVSIDQVATEAWWNTTTKAKEGSDVVRILPFRGHRASDFTQIDLAGEIWINAIVNNGTYDVPYSFICEGKGSMGHFLGISPLASSNGYGILPFRKKLP